MTDKPNMPQRIWAIRGPWYQWREDIYQVSYVSKVSCCDAEFSEYTLTSSVQSRLSAAEEMARALDKVLEWLEIEIFDDDIRGDTSTQ